MNVGIVGFGGFGQLLAETLQANATVKVYSRTMQKVPEPLQATLQEVCACDYVVLSVPFGSYRAVLADMALYLTKDTVVVDVCSVKIKPAQLIRKLLPNNPLVATHPLFGPQTIQDGLAGHVLVVCDDVSDQTHADKIATLAEQQGLRVVRMSSEEHDKQMASVHALTFFVARSLLDMNIAGVELVTPSFERLMSLVELERNHTYELFETIETGNPFASDVREQFLQAALHLQKELTKKEEV